MKILLCNAFSLNMLDLSLVSKIEIKPLTAFEVSAYLAENKFESVVGHADTAAVFADVLGISVPTNRVTVSLDDRSTVLIVGQYKGPRLAEGTVHLPEGATIEWVKVNLV